MSSQLSRRDGGDSDDDLGPVIIRFGIAMIIIPVVTIALRFWSRALGLGIKSSNGSRFWWDDWLALAVIVSWLLLSDHSDNSRMLIGSESPSASVKV